MKELLNRHKKVIEVTKDNGKYAITVRGLKAFFGQKIRNSTSLICTQYEEGGLYYEKYIKNNNRIKTKKKASEKNKYTVEGIPFGIFKD